MANEITYQFQTLLSNGSLSDSFASNSQSADQASAFLIRNVQTIGTAAAGEALALGDVTTAGWAVFQNLDDTNFVEIGVAGFTAFLKLKPGELCLVRLGTNAPLARADTADVDLFYIIYSD
jgi:hypothetical protein